MNWGTNERLPFDWHTPWGYLIAIGLESIITFCLNLYIACVVALTLGCFLFAISTTKDINSNLRSLNKQAKIGQSEADIYEEFTEIISLHSEQKQLS